mmetsp:Transcript_62985/g.137604  ORF Transcript_62985/g.137604 Transcript_62985/m.137604 type:complete len:241 (-) Transcript_62985:224-946(-)
MLPEMSQKPLVGARPGRQELRLNVCFPSVCMGSRTTGSILALRGVGAACRGWRGTVTFVGGKGACQLLELSRHRWCRSLSFGPSAYMGSGARWASLSNRWFGAPLLLWSSCSNLGCLSPTFAGARTTILATICHSSALLHERRKEFANSIDVWRLLRHEVAPFVRVHFGVFEVFQHEFTRPAWNVVVSPAPNVERRQFQRSFRWVGLNPRWNWSPEACDEDGEARWGEVPPLHLAAERGH